MFKKFNVKENCSSLTKVKSSISRAIKSSICEQIPPLAPFIDDIFPKKEPLYLGKCSGGIELIVLHNQVIFFCSKKEQIYFPHLKILHKYPDALPKMQVDRGAVKFLLSGANVMCRGLTSKGAKMDKVPKDKVVAVTVEGKASAIAVGFTLMSSVEIAKKNNGIGIEIKHYLGDGIWNLDFQNKELELKE